MPAQAEPRDFTLAEARRTLPLVRRIVEDIVTSWPPLQQRLLALRRRSPSGAGHEPELRALREEVDRQADVVNAYLDELRSIGCLFKGFEEGLVDWYALWGDRRILLCWKHGEEDIAWWHDPDAGFAGRRPITEEMEAELDGG